MSIILAKLFLKDGCKEHQEGSYEQKQCLEKMQLMKDYLIRLKEDRAFFYSEYIKQINDDNLKQFIEDISKNLIIIEHHFHDL